VCGVEVVPLVGAFSASVVTFFSTCVGGSCASVAPRGLGCGGGLL
jgi:hypothetical protein